MNGSLHSPSVNNDHPEREVARRRYFELRDKLVSMKSVVEPDQAAIEAVVWELEQAQLAYKAMFGLFGNNPNDDPSFSAHGDRSHLEN